MFPSITILGSRSKETGLQQVLTTCYGCNVSVFDTDVFLAEDIVIEARRHLKQSDFAIFFPRLPLHIERIIQLIQRLRGGYYWEGTFVAVMPTHEQRRKLDETSLLGNLTPQRRERFGELRGHIALSEPLTLADLFEVLRESDDFTLEDWSTLRDKSELVELSKLAQALRQSMADTEERIPVALDKFLSAHWFSHLNHIDYHAFSECKHEVNQRYRQDRSLTLQDYLYIVERIEYFLERSTL